MKKFLRWNAVLVAVFLGACSSDYRDDEVVVEGNEYETNPGRVDPASTNAMEGAGVGNEELDSQQTGQIRMVLMQAGLTEPQIQELQQDGYELEAVRVELESAMNQRQGEGQAGQRVDDLVLYIDQIKSGEVESAWGAERRWPGMEAGQEEAQTQLNEQRLRGEAGRNPGEPTPLEGGDRTEMNQDDSEQENVIDDRGPSEGASQDGQVTVEIEREQASLEGQPEGSPEASATNEAMKRQLRQSLQGQEAASEMNEANWQEIQIQAREGSVVLQGTVPSEQAKEAIANQLREISGGQQVDNQLRVSPRN